MQVDQSAMSFCYVCPDGPDISPESVTGTVVLFCNGVDNDIEDAKDCARRVSYAFHNKPVLVCHNPTALKPILEQEEIFEITLILSLAQRISKLASNIQITSLHLVTHSHGAFLTKQALTSINNNQIRNKISVYSFGGVAIIPKTLGYRVTNWMVAQDLVITAHLTHKGISARRKEGGQHLLDTIEFNSWNRALTNGDVGPEQVGSLLDGINSIEEQAVRCLAFRKLQERLRLENKPEISRENKNEIDDHEYFRESKEYYEKILREYDIKIIPGIPFDKVLDQANQVFEIVKKNWIFFLNIGSIKKAGALAIDGVLKNHTFPEFYADCLIKELANKKI